MGGPIDLSATFELASGSGIFSGWGRVLVYSPAQAIHINVETGQVTPIPGQGSLGAQACVSPFHWGIVEAWEGGLYLLYVAEGGDEVMRARLSDGAAAPLATFSDLGDACGLAVSPMRLTWITHISGPSQFSSTLDDYGVTCAADIRVP